MFCFIFCSPKNRNDVTYNNYSSGEIKYEDMTAELMNIAKNAPDIVSMFSIGTTYEGRELWVM